MASPPPVLSTPRSSRARVLVVDDQQEIVKLLRHALRTEPFDLTTTCDPLEARRLACSDASVLITGETGTGKDVMARFIHALSKRRGEPFVDVNCAAIPETLVDSALFGHARGSFTGATESRDGFF